MDEPAFVAPRFMTVAEVADVTRVSRMTVYRMVHAGTLPAVRVGRSFRVPESAVRQMIARSVVESPAEAEERSAG